ncbi:hypothetical protein [Bacillus sp. Marseille-P3800]|uniref:hypothetical protein n=1 Tax=Bacillus sp. Marseille-P3800 TaxID=2014782 RepID=UPI000C06FC12|nr:hypothetical protein [Bacillus sp. Marseille-P3800]
MNRATWIIFGSALMLAACSPDEERAESPEVNGTTSESQTESTDEVNEVNDTEERSSEESDDATTEDREDDEPQASDDEQAEETNESPEEEQSSDGEVSLNPEEIIANAIAAEEQFEQYSLEWQHHDVAEDGAVMEAKGYTVLKYMANPNGPDYYYRETSGTELAEEEGGTVYEAQTPEARSMYIEGDDHVTLLRANDEQVPTISQVKLNEFIGDYSVYDIEYRGIFETEGFRAHHLFAVSDNENTEINLWFDTETGIQVRQNQFFAGYDGTVSRLTMFDPEAELTDADFQISHVSQYSIIDER